MRIVRGCEYGFVIGFGLDVLQKSSNNLVDLNCLIVQFASLDDPLLPFPRNHLQIWHAQVLSRRKNGATH